MAIAPKSTLCAVVLSAWLALPAGAASISTLTLPEGNTILQITGAVAGMTDGGVATSDTRTLYYFAPDFGDPQINLHDFMGTTWPYVFIDGPLKVDSSITASISTASTAAGDILLIDGNPLYQFFNDTTPKDANGNFGPWFFVRPDGSATQAVVPIPAPLLLLASSLLGLLTVRRRVR